MTMEFIWVVVRLMALTTVLVCFSSASSAITKELANQQPHRVKADVINSTSLRLRWSRPKAEIVCPTRRFMIRLKESGGGAGAEGARAGAGTGGNRALVWKVDAGETSFVVRDLRPNTAYLVRILAENCESKWRSTKWIGVQTTTTTATEDRSTEDTRSHGASSHRPPAQPTRVRTEARENSVFVSWEPSPSSSSQGGPVIGYMIGYGEGVPDVNWQYVENRQRNVTIRNLKALTQYVVSVSAFNDFGKSAAVYDLVYTKSRTAEPKLNFSSSLVVPTNVRLRQSGHSSVDVEWSDPSLDRPDLLLLSDGRYYNVHYRKASPHGAGPHGTGPHGASPDATTMSILVKDLRVKVDDLLPSTRYEFKVRAVRGEEMTRFSETLIAKTNDDAEEEEEEEEEEDGGEETVSRAPPPDNETERAEDDEDDDDLLGGSPSPPPGSSRRSKKRRTQPRRDGVYAVHFRSVVYHKVNAFVTWPHLPEQQQQTTACDVTAEAPPVVGYRLRYSRRQPPLPSVEEEEKERERGGDEGGGGGGGGGGDEGGGEAYVTKDVVENFLLLEDLLPESKYQYQVQYLFGGNATSSVGWSDQGIIDTHYSDDVSKSKRAKDGG